MCAWVCDDVIMGKERKRGTIFNLSVSSLSCMGELIMSCHVVQAVERVPMTFSLVRSRTSAEGKKRWHLGGTART